MHLYNAENIQVIWISLRFPNKTQVLFMGFIIKHFLMENFKHREVERIVKWVPVGLASLKKCTYLFTIILKYVYECSCACRWCLCIGTPMHAGVEGARVIGSCELMGVGAGDWTQVLLKEQWILLPAELLLLSSLGTYPPDSVINIQFYFFGHIFVEFFLIVPWRYWLLCGKG